MADRVVIMRDGEIQQIATPDTLFQRPANLFVAGFMGSPGMNFLSTSTGEVAGEPIVPIFGQNVSVSGRGLNGARELIAGIRPEHIKLGEGPVSFTVRPHLVESLGSEKYLYFDGGSQTLSRRTGDDESTKGLIARVSHSGALKEGEEVALSFDPADLYLFDAQTEKAIS